MLSLFLDDFLKCFTLSTPLFIKTLHLTASTYRQTGLREAIKRPKNSKKQIFYYFIVSSTSTQTLPL